MLRKLLLSLSVLALGVSSSPAREDGFRGEPADPCEHDLSVWQGLGPGIHSGFGSIDTAYARSLPPAGKTSPSVLLHGWKGERVNSQFLLWSKRDTGRIQLECGGLRQGDHEIGESNVSISVVKFVLTDQFLNEKGTACGPRDNDQVPVHLAPDILDAESQFRFDGPGTRPVWIAIDIPPDAPAGHYSGTLDVRSASGHARHEIRLEVLDHRLPAPREWAYHLDLWQNPFAVARFHRVKPWSEAHMGLLRPYLTLLAEAGQKCITTTLIDRPWGTNKPCYDDHRSMIRWTRKADGSWDYDYTIFDRYVRLAMDCGITQQINAYTMVPIDNEFTWFDEGAGETVVRKLLPGTREYRDHWRPFLQDFTRHLKDRGWLEKTTIGLDERGEEEMARMLAFLRETAPGLKVTAAGFYHESIDHLIHDFSSNWRDQLRIPVEKIRERKAAGLITTYYVACGIPKPNNFTFSPPAESCFEGWMAAAMGFDGFLRWAYNSWPKTPLTDSRYVKWPAGDTFFIYPGPQSSIRFERLREGIQDFEKIRILRAALAKSSAAEAAALGRRLEGFLGAIGPDTLDAITAAEVIRQGKDLIDQVAREVPSESSENRIPD